MSLDNNFFKVINFYKSLPDNIINDVLNKIKNDINRDTRRKFSKIKTKGEKIEFLLCSQLRNKFCDIAYSMIKDSVPLKLEQTSYQEIVSGINDENKVAYTLFFFRWCYEKDETGIPYDKRYFSIFVNSEIFDRIVKQQSLEGINNHFEDQTVTEIQISSEPQQKEVIEEPTQDSISTENITYSDKKEAGSMKLLGRIEKRLTFYNFFPNFSFENGILTEMSQQELEIDYPEKGGINLSYTFNNPSNTFLKSIEVDNDSDEYVKNLYMININSYDIEENDNIDYKFKLDLAKLVSQGEDLSDIIQPASDYKIYKVVTSETERIPDNTFISNFIYLKETNLVNNELVILFYDNKYYGPVTVQYRAIDGKYYVKSGANENNYIVPYYKKENIEQLELMKQAYGGESKYSSFVYAKGSQLQSDHITDEILLEKISENISLEMFAKNPDEFSHIRRNSPFMAKLSDDIIAMRIERVKNIVTSVQKFENEKREIFEILLGQYQNGSAKISDKLVKGSEAYKELNSKYLEEINKNTSNDNRIKELNKIIDELKTANNELSDQSNNSITSEEIRNYEEKIKELENNLKKLEKIKDLNDSIDELTAQQKELEANNKYITNKTKEYEDRLETLKKDIVEDIASGSKKMAALAFDPFISSKMMSEAASWETKNENDNYNITKEKFENIVPSFLSGTELTNYIVNYVKARRNYSRNEIINIYISIAQNFITIFSGKPGTGKTSMCNIIAETLGLMDYGENMSRFVPVSVERGWSSKRDFIGYYNPLTRKYDKNNSRVYDALRLLDMEKNNSRYPFVIMLDEANLSPIEYYWADFMRLTDRASESDSCLNIGIDNELFVPETLRFLATINADQTTEILSPRLIDRACIIKLPNVAPKPDVPEKNGNFELVTWKNFIETFNKETELSTVTMTAIDKIFKQFNDYGMTVSPRIDLGIKKYIKAAQSIMEDEGSILARDKALDFAVVQKLLPKINGYYSVYERFFESLRSLCQEYNLQMTEDAIIEIENFQKNNMGYCQYLI